MAFPSVPKRLKFATRVKEMPESSMELVRAAMHVAVERFEAMFESWATELLNVAWEGYTRPIPPRYGWTKGGFRRLLRDVHTIGREAAAGVGVPRGESPT
jgi:hypothetical protein